MVIIIWATGIVLYSFILNFSFGHKQYWKVGHLIEYIICTFWSAKMNVHRNYYYLYMQKLGETKRCLSEKNVRCLTAIKKKSLFSSLPDDLLFKTLSYLDAYHLITIISRLSRRFRQISRQKSLWEELTKTLLDSALKISYGDRWLVVQRNLRSRLLSLSSTSSNSIGAYFTMVHEILISLANENSIHKCSASIILDNSIYDISRYIDEHPGGPAILLEWNGKDATKLFRMAHHSSFAYQLRRSMLIWSAVPISGRKGAPKHILNEMKNEKQPKEMTIAILESSIREE